MFLAAYFRSLHVPFSRPAESKEIKEIKKAPSLCHLRMSLHIAVVLAAEAAKPSSYTIALNEVEKRLLRKRAIPFHRRRFVNLSTAPCYFDNALLRGFT